MTVDQPGTVVEGVDVAGAILVLADDVTIRNFRANNVEQASGVRGLLLEDGEIHGEQDPSADGVRWNNYTARRLNVHGVNDAFKAHGNVVIEDCWVHDLHFVVSGPGSWTHNDGVQVSSGSNVVIRNSRFEGNRGNAAVFVDPDFGPISDVVIEGNWLGGGGYTLYVVPSPKAPVNGMPADVVVRDNTFTEEHLFDYATVGSSVTWFGNTNEGGEAVLPVPWA